MKFILAVGAFALTVSIYSCSEPKLDDRISKGQEINLPSYFEKEIETLSNDKITVKKTVQKDNEIETKEIEIKDWKSELASFAAIDLNKSVYSSSIKKDSSNNVVRYTFKDPNIDLKLVEIHYTGVEATLIQIKKNTDNLLYQTEEYLEYHKGVSYTIQKIQNVRFLNTTTYRIRGAF